MNFSRKRAMTRSVCFVFLPIYDGPMFKWRFFFIIALLWFKYVQQSGTVRTHSTKGISINVLTTESLTWIRVKQTNTWCNRANLSQTIFLKYLQFNFKFFNVLTATNTWTDLNWWRHDMKYFPHYRRFVREIQLFSLMPAWTICLTNSRVISYLRCHSAHVWITFCDNMSLAHWCLDKAVALSQTTFPNICVNENHEFWFKYLWSFILVSV